MLWLWRDCKKPVFQSNEKKSVKEYGGFEIGGVAKNIVRKNTR